ncbi:MAG: PilZ domain-containing protein [Beijerinckiaceae bacterium]
MNLKLSIAQKPIERRRHQRVKVSILGRYMLANKREYPCQTIDMSPGGVALFAPVPGEIGERVIVYLDQLGRIEGVIARHTKNGFALSMTLPLMKREKLAEQMIWIVNRDSLGLEEDRRHERVTPRISRTVLRLEDGKEYRVKIIDISLSGAAIATDVQPPLGSKIVVGQTNGQVVRHFQGGIAIEFARPLALEAFEENITL